MSDEEFKEYLQHHPVRPDERYQGPTRVLQREARQDFIASANRAHKTGDLDLDQFGDRIRDVGELADTVLPTGTWNEEHVLGVHQGWEWVSWYSLGAMNPRVITRKLGRKMGYTTCSRMLPDARYPEAVLRWHGEEEWVWVHPRWRWVFEEDGE